MPAGENLVTSAGLPRPGPLSSMRVAAVTRRLRGEACTTPQLPLASNAPLLFWRMTSITETPCIATSRSTSPVGRAPLARLVGPAACRNSGLMYSWFIASTPRALPLPMAVGTAPLSVSG